jgi:excisionase family DNA binding protein
MQFEQQVTCTVRQACEATGLGKTTITEAVSSGTIKSKLIGTRRILKVASVLAFVAPDDSLKPRKKAKTTKSQQVDARS